MGMLGHEADVEASSVSLKRVSNTKCPKANTGLVFLGFIVHGLIPSRDVRQPSLSDIHSNGAKIQEREKMSGRLDFSVVASFNNRFKDVSSCP